MSTCTCKTRRSSYPSDADPMTLIVDQMCDWHGKKFMSVTADNRCRVCDQGIRLTFKPRYWCCNGTDCGCNGATLPDDICSVTCGEQAEFDDNEELGAVDLEEQLDSAFERADNRT